MAEGSGRPRTLGERLRFAIDGQPPLGRKRGLRLFQSRMAVRAEELRRAGERVPEGIVLSSIQSYLADDVVPPLSFLEEAARVLDVRPEWLALASGLPTEAEQSEAERAAREMEGTMQRSAAPVIVEVWNALGDGVPGFWRLPHLARRDLIESFSRFARLPSVAEHRGPHKRFAPLVERFAQYLRTPFELVAVDPEGLSPAEVALVFDGLMKIVDVAYWNSEHIEAEGDRPQSSKRQGKNKRRKCGEA